MKKAVLSFLIISGIAYGAEPPTSPLLETQEEQATVAKKYEQDLLLRMAQAYGIRVHAALAGMFYMFKMPRTPQ